MRGCESKFRLVPEDGIGSDIEGFAKVVNKDEVLQENNGNLSVQLFVKSGANASEHDLPDLLRDVRKQKDSMNDSIEDLFEKLGKIGIGKTNNLVKQTERVAH